MHITYSRLCIKTGEIKDILDWFIGVAQVRTLGVGIHSETKECFMAKIAEMADTICIICKTCETDPQCRLRAAV
uniref:Uncharacterized protein n=1 Tax=mine drainage metagenome TaxID=410659 RepID=E6QCA5_9ZZZZ